MRFSLPCTILVFFIGYFIVGFTNHSLANEIEICKTCEISTISEGIRTAKVGDTLNIHDGLYREHNLVIDKPLVVIGKGNPVIDGELKGEILKIVSDNVVVDGLNFINVGVSYTSDFAAVRVVNSRNFTLKNLTLRKMFFGIYLEKSGKGEVRDNTVIGDAVEEFNSGNGIHLWQCDSVLVSGNNISAVRDGIYLEFSDYIKIENNRSHHNVRYGLHFMFSNFDEYRDNVFSNNGAGVAVMFSKQIKMIGNTFQNNWGPASFGLLLKEINDAEIKGNNFISNTIGINVEGSNRIEYTNNQFSENGWAMKIRGACYSNTVSRNNFLNNSFDLGYNSKPNDNVFRENYWSRYTGYDLDKNGIGDVPYRPVKLFSYVVNRTPESIILLRSLFMDILDFSERVSPVFTPDNLIDPRPLMRKVQ